MNRNKWHNVSNPHQNIEKYKRVLCVCSAGLLRSPTIARVLQEKYGYNTRAAGISIEYALIHADSYLVEWADEIVCADISHEEYIRLQHTGLVSSLGLSIDIPPPIKTLNLPDEFGYMDEELCKLILERYKDDPLS